MQKKGTSAFILPMALVLATGILSTGVLIWQWQIHSLPIKGTDLLRQRARNTLLANLPALKQLLEKQILEAGATSAIQFPDDPDSGPALSVIASSERPEWKPIGSLADPVNASRLAFQSPVGPKSLAASLVRLDSGEASVNLSIAWTAEDISLRAAGTPPPEFWPLPDWNLVPAIPRDPFPLLLDQLTQGTWQTLPWIDREAPLPMLEEYSPALVPVIQTLGLRFGIFAAGPVRSREKTIRVRFFLEGSYWNPYNRPLALHPGRGTRSVLRVVFWNLPEVRIHNRSQGLSSSWISLDSAQNGQTGSRGLHAWVKAPGTMEAGGRISFFEPDPRRQPEGLARTLHPGYMVGPADRIEIEMRQPVGGIHVACLPLESADPWESALVGDGWFRAEAFPAKWPGLQYNRADSGDHPFLLSGGSLSFRPENAQFAVSFHRNPALDELSVDPRRARVNYHEALKTADGRWIAASQFMQLTAGLGTEVIHPDPDPPQPRALFSWPAKTPGSLLEATDLPAWQEGFRLGTTGAASINALLESEAAFLVSKSDQMTVSLVDPEGNFHPYQPAFSVNLQSAEVWGRLLAQAARPSATGTYQFPAYVFPSAGNTAQSMSWSGSELNSAAQALADAITFAPVASVPDLFNSGIIHPALILDKESSFLSPLLPLRGWLRNGTIPRSHGSGWILHIAIRAVKDELETWSSARVWLLETHLPGSLPMFEIIRFEWTQPGEHLAFPFS